MYHYLLQPRDEHDDQHKRATDRIWSEATYKFCKIVKDSGNWVMYCLSNGPDRAFVSEELMLIPEDTKLPPNYIKKWSYLFNWIDIATDVNGSRKVSSSFQQS